MSEQFSLDGFAEPVVTDRLFLALLPDAQNAESITRLTQGLRAECNLKGKPIAAERLHVTLYFLGDFAGLPQGIVERTNRAASALAVREFEVVLDRVMSFKSKSGKSPFVLCGGDGVDALLAFQRALFLAMSKEGLKPADRATSFTPHVTLLYDRHSVPQREVEPISWRANEFVLVRSAIGLNRYETIAHWPLGK